MGGFEECRHKLEDIERDDEPFWQPTTRSYTLSVVEQTSPYRDTLHLSGSEDIELGTLALTPGHGKLTVVKENVPFVVASGIERVCSSLRRFIQEDSKWRQLGEQKLAVQEAYFGAFSLSNGFRPSRTELSLFCRGLSVIGCSFWDFMYSHTDEERSEIVRAKMSELDAEASRQPTIRINGLDYFANLRFDGAPIFSNEHPEYHSYCADSRKFVRGLEDSIMFSRLRRSA